MVPGTADVESCSSQNPFLPSAGFLSGLLSGFLSGLGYKMLKPRCEAGFQ
jgi:fructose-specific phosphotransferase system IIC component